MIKKFQILKSGRGIVIFYEIKLCARFDINDYSVFKIAEKTYVKIIENKLDSESLFYLFEAIKNVRKHFKDEDIFFEMQFEFDLLHFQPEALYYTFMQWFAEAYNISQKSISFSYEGNKFIFPELDEMRKNR